MIAADTSSLIAYFSGDAGADTGLIQAALTNGQICLSPVVLTELLSDAKTRPALEPVVALWPLLDILDGYWVRAAQTRGKLFTHGLKPKIPDTLIAQSCIDHGVELITRDSDFRHFAKHCGLKLA